LIPIVLLFAGGFLVVGSASLAAAALRLPSSLSLVLAAYLIAWAEVVAVTELLSLFRGVSAGGYLGVEALVFAVAVVIWVRVGRPRPPIPRLQLGLAVRAHPVLTGLAIVCALAVAYEVVVAVTTPPTTIDELWYHLARAAAWVRHGGLYRIPGGNAAENDYPPNAEIGALYGFAFLHRDTFAAVPQLTAQLAVAVSIAGIARRLGSSRAAAVFSGLLFLTLSAVAVNAMTALNDIVVAAFVAAAAYFVLGRDGRTGLALGGLALGLALGTKYTAFFVQPALLLLAVVVLRPRRLTMLAAWTVLGFAAVGAYGYAENLAHSRTPLGAGAQEIGSATAVVTARGTVSTMARNLYRFGDLPGYRIKTRWLHPLQTLGKDAFRILHVPTAPPEASTGGSPFSFEINVGSNTGNAWFGPLGWVLLVPLSIAFGVAWALRKVGRRRGALALSLPIYFLVTALVYRYTSQGRFFITPIALTLPLAAVLYERRRLSSAIAAIAALTLLFALAYDTAKPTGLGGTTSIWRLSRADAETLNLGPQAADVIRAVDRLPEDEDIGFQAQQLYVGYALYGPHLRRSLVALSPGDPLGDARRRGLRAVYLGPEEAVPAQTLDWTATRYGAAGTLLIRRTGAG
jgi:Dolichyl-phosphate-mannose-protein mannosyltransferase